MMRLLPMKQSRVREGEPLISLACGVPALSIGVGSIIVLFSHLINSPIGSADFYERGYVSVTERDRFGLVSYMPVKRLMPTPQLLGMLWVGICSAGLGIYASRRRWPHRRVTHSATGLIVCAMAFLAAWILVAVAAWG